MKQKEELELKHKTITGQLGEILKLNADGNAVINEMKAQARRLEQEKEVLQNEAQIAKTEVLIYSLIFVVLSWCVMACHGVSWCVMVCHSVSWCIYV